MVWLRDESLEDSANLPDPDILAVDIAEVLRAALDQLAQIAADLGIQRRAGSEAETSHLQPTR